MKDRPLNEVPVAELELILEEARRSKVHYCLVCGFRIEKGNSSSFCSTRCKSFHTANASAIVYGVAQQEREALLETQRELLRELADQAKYIQQLETKLQLLQETS